MRVFHLVSAEYGLQDVRERRLKIATLDELNDPFDFFGADLGDPTHRRRLAAARQSIGQNVGLLCFSERWDNPVLWSHYADKHRGICLGFEIPDELLGRVTYANRRFKLQPDPLKASGAPDKDSAEKLMFTKYSHWRYEREWRMFAPLHKAQVEDGRFFASFDTHIRLTTLIVGALSPLTRDDLARALSDISSQVQLIKARLAFRSFRVVRQRDRRLW